MRIGRVCLGFLIVTAVGLAVAAERGAPAPPSPAATAAAAPSGLVVHEWGTFLGMSGSDGVALEGMYHEEHALPAFVHARSRDQLKLRSTLLKGETPVVYFYTRREQKVQVRVGFPRGLWTQWYPQAQVVGPNFSGATTPPDLRDGHILWCARVLPASSGTPNPAPPAPERGSLWGYARDVDAAFVQTRDATKRPAATETERFLFYRGLGRATLPVRLTADGGGTLSSHPADKHGVRHVFVVRVEGGRGAYAYAPGLKPGGRLSGLIPPTADTRPIEEFSRRLGDDLASRLVESGLYPKEARAMVNTWRSSYFETDGVRALFVMPPAWTEEVAPMSVSPVPDTLVRVMVGRLELMTPDRERAAGQAVADLASPDAAARARAYDFLVAQGRYAEPVVRRVAAATGDPRVRALCRRLLLTDFVTELRAAARPLPGGTTPSDEPVHVRGQLAALLREIGQEAEAKAEGSAVLAALRGRPEPPADRVELHAYLRTLARATEAVGDDRGAVAGYERFIRYGSRVVTESRCLGCHQAGAPRDLAWFRDWWAGRRYAEAAVRAGVADQAVAAREAAAVSGPAATADRLMLVYLYDARGETARASAVWDGLLARQVEAP